MTLVRNFPGRKNERRISALKRLEKRIEMYEKFESGELIPISPASWTEKLRSSRRELTILNSRIAKGGRKTTKKVGSNIGRRLSQ